MASSPTMPKRINWTITRVEFRLTQPDASFMASGHTLLPSCPLSTPRESLANRQELLGRQPVGTGRCFNYRAGRFIRLQRTRGFWRSRLMRKWWI